MRWKSAGMTRSESQMYRDLVSPCDKTQPSFLAIDAHHDCGETTVQFRCDYGITWYTSRYEIQAYYSYHCFIVHTGRMRQTGRGAGRTGQRDPGINSKPTTGGQYGPAGHRRHNSRNRSRRQG